MRSTLLAATYLMTCLPANAQLPPVFDMVDWCKAYVASGSFPVSGVLGCVKIEEFHVRKLQGLYSTVPDKIREACENYSREKTDGLGSYVMLSLCIDEKRRR